MNVKIIEARKNDKSFTKKGLLGIEPKYSQNKVRDIYFNAMAIGMKMGLDTGSINGQRIELYDKTSTTKEKMFLDKLYELSEKYNCAVKYHPVDGMCVVSLNKI